MKYIEAKGDTLDAAIESALAQLGKTRDEVSVEVLQKPKAGFLGLGKEPAIVRVSYEDTPTARAVEFLQGLLERFGTPAQVHAQENAEERTILLELSGDNMNAVIGHHGDTLDAIQYLTNIVTNRKEEERWRITVDTENYRAKREESLCALAQKTAQKALKTAMELFEIEASRPAHDALGDAYHTALICAKLDLRRGIAEYEQALKSHENGFHGAELPGCIRREVFRDLPDRETALAAMSGRENSAK